MDSLSRPGELLGVTCPRTYLECPRIDAMAEPIGRHRNGIGRPYRERERPMQKRIYTARPGRLSATGPGLGFRV